MTSMEFGASIGPFVETVEEVDQDFDFVELAVGEGAVALENVDKQRLRKLLDENGLELIVHLPFRQPLVTTIEAFNDANMDYMKDILDFCRRMSVKKAVAHVDLRANEPGPEHYGQIKREMERLQKRGESRGIEICFENAGSFGNKYPFDLADIVREIEGSMCFDTGHMFAEHGQDQMEVFLEQNLDLVSHFHIQDTREGHDMHMPVGSGEIDWAMLAEFFADFEGTVCMEIITGDQDYHAISARKLQSYMSER